MPKGLPKDVRNQLDKCRAAAISAVEVYNKPRTNFRTAHYTILIILAWNAFFHAYFYREGIRPWYSTKSSSSGRGVRYEKIDGEPKHWDLKKCIKEFYKDKQPPERKNLSFLLGLRNKIEHRDIPELEMNLYGECQSALINLEDYLFDYFGKKYSLSEQLSMSLQFTRSLHSEKKRALSTLALKNGKEIKNYIEDFRAKLPEHTLNSMKYAFSVFLVPKVANRKSAGDVAIEFVKIDEDNRDETERLEKLNVLIKKKHIPIANLDMYKPSKIIEEVNKKVDKKIKNMHFHTNAWKYYKIRPASNSKNPEDTQSQYCVYDPVHGDYLYTKAWINKLIQAINEKNLYEEINNFKEI